MIYTEYSFCPKILIQENSPYTEHDFSLISGFTKLLFTIIIANVKFYSFWSIYQDFKIKKKYMVDLEEQCE